MHSNLIEEDINLSVSPRRQFVPNTARVGNISSDMMLAHRTFKSGDTQEANASSLESNASNNRERITGGFRKGSPG